MKIEIRQENYKQLLQCVYLGNLIINGHRKQGEELREYSDFAESVLSQAVCALPERPGYGLKKMPSEKSEDAKLSDLNDMLYDSVKDFYTDHLKSEISEIIDFIY